MNISVKRCLLHIKCLIVKKLCRDSKVHIKRHQKMCQLIRNSTTSAGCPPKIYICYVYVFLV